MIDRMLTILFLLIGFIGVLLPVAMSMKKDFKFIKYIDKNNRDLYKREGRVNESGRFFLWRWRIF